ncbi:MAG: AAA family ATPase [Flavobacteriales bacterium]
MNTNSLPEKIKSNFQFSFTKEQEQLVEEVSEFVNSISTRNIFLLKGYAGTGKTSLISSLVNSLSFVGKKSSLLAPTGRAAKVLSKYSKKSASTIHRKIYWINSNKSGNTYIKLKENTHSNTIFIVDEASMIPESSDKGFGNRSLLDDLIEYVYNGIGCKLILIGDTAQLPPVSLDISPALSEIFLSENYSKEILSFSLSEVVRQDKSSTILVNATNIRNQISNSIFNIPKFLVSDDVIRIETGDELQENLESNYNKGGTPNTIVLCRSNKRANIYNQQIRSRIKYLEEEISTGDLLMVVRNNYFWLGEKNSSELIANGDIIEVLSVNKILTKHGFKFADVTIRLIDFLEEKEIDLIVMLDTITLETSSLSYEEYQKLYHEISKDYNGDRKKIKEDKYLNALQVKFSYAITCHKSQGGQWENVFVDLGYFKNEMLDLGYLRWMYTAITRASKKLYLINFKNDFF